MNAKYYLSEADLGANQDQIVGAWALGLEGLVDDAAQAKYRHYYLDNPAGIGMCLLLHELAGNKAVGAQGLIPRTFYAGQRRFSAATLADFVVAPGHRSLGPALKLMRSCIALSQDRFDFVYGTPNEKSRAILNRAGIHPLGALTRYTKLLRSESYLSERVPRWMVSPVATVADAAIASTDFVRDVLFGSHFRWSEPTTFSAEFEKVWQGRQADIVSSERSPTTLRWRYSTAKPESPWHFSLAADRTDTPIGYVIWRQVNEIAMIDDFFCSNMEESVRALLQSFVVHARRFRVHKVSLEFLGPPSISAALVACGFAPRNQSHVVVVDRAKGDGDRSLFSPGRIFMTSFDRDRQI